VPNHGSCIVAQITPPAEGSVETPVSVVRQLPHLFITNISINMSDATQEPKKERFAPKERVTLQPPKDDIIERTHLAKCDGMRAACIY
jgi:hypothetical protein